MNGRTVVRELPPRPETIRPPVIIPQRTRLSLFDDLSRGLRVDATYFGNRAGQVVQAQAGISLGSVDANLGVGTFQLNRHAAPQLFVPMRLGFGGDVGRMHLSARYGIAFMPDTSQNRGGIFQDLSLGGVYRVADGSRFGINIGLQLHGTIQSTSLFDVGGAQQGHFDFAAGASVRMDRVTVYGMGRFLVAPSRPYEQYWTDIRPHFIEATAGLRLSTARRYLLDFSYTHANFMDSAGLMVMMPSVALSPSLSVRYTRTSGPFGPDDEVRVGLGFALERSTRSPRGSAHYEQAVVTTEPTRRAGTVTLTNTDLPRMEVETHASQTATEYETLRSAYLSGTVDILSFQNQLLGLITSAWHARGLRFDPSSLRIMTLSPRSFVRTIGPGRTLSVPEWGEYELRPNGAPEAPALRRVRVNFVTGEISITDYEMHPDGSIAERAWFDSEAQRTNPRPMDVVQQRFRELLISSPTLEGFVRQVRATGTSRGDIIQMAAHLGNLAQRRYDTRLRNASVFGEREELGQITTEVVFDHIRRAVLDGEGLSAGICANIHSFMADILRRAGFEANAIAIPSPAGAHVVTVARDSASGTNYLLDYGTIYQGQSQSIWNVIEDYAQRNRVVIQGIYVYGQNDRLTGFYTPPEGEIVRRMSGEEGARDEFRERLIGVPRRTRRGER